LVSNQSWVENFRPTIPVKIRKIKKSLLKIAGSLNKMMPRLAAPTIPIPVQTAYAVPIGKLFKAVESKKKLAIKAMPVKMLGTGLVQPWVYLSPTAQAISNIPAKIRKSHAEFLIASPPTPKL
jgi:hypothetical protein